MSHIGYDKYEEGNALLAKKHWKVRSLPSPNLKRKKIIRHARS